MFSASRPTLAALLAALLLLQAPAVAGEPAEEERDLEPLPRSVVFHDPAAGGLDLETNREIRTTIQRAFASLGTVEAARALLVERYGLVSVPALVDVLQRKNNVTEVWNAALTVAALRETYGPAYELKVAVRPLLKTLEGGGDAHTRAMAALALGCFHHEESRLPARGAVAEAPYEAVPGVAQSRARAARALRDARARLAEAANDPLTFMRVAAMFALAKTGGAEARETFLAQPLADFTNVAPRRAMLLTRAFLLAGDVEPYETALRDEDRRVRSTAALAMAVAMLQEHRVPWTRDSEAVLAALSGTKIIQTEDRAEACFARGICAWANQSNAEWEAIWDQARTDSTHEQVAEACAQVLLFCRLPWFQIEIGKWTRSPRVVLKAPVLSLLLLRAGEQADAETLPALVAWLRSSAKRPRPAPRWDPRWYAAVGLLRALEQGRIESREHRLLVVEALRKAVSSTWSAPAVKDHPFRAALGDLLDVHADKLAGAPPDALYRLPRAARQAVEASCPCPHGLLARDPVDACVGRVNRALYRIFELDAIPAWKPGQPNVTRQPDRYLRRYVRKHPYFTRLEFRADRGARPRPALAHDEQGIDR